MYTPTENSEASMGVVNEENRVATATISISSTPMRPSAAACPESTTAPVDTERTTKAKLMITSCNQTVSTSPKYLPSRNSLRETGFERMV